MKRLKQVALSAALVVAAVGIGASPHNAEAQTVIVCGHGYSGSQSWSRCTGMYGTQRQRAVVTCFNWGTYYYYGNRAANGVLSQALCGAGATAIGSSYQLL